MSISPELLAHREEILRIARKHGVGRVRVFGSMARNEARADSDVDLLIEVDGPTTPWFPGGLVYDLEALLGRPVQVVTPTGLWTSMRDTVLKEAVLL